MRYLIFTMLIGLILSCSDSRPQVAVIKISFRENKDDFERMRLYTMQIWQEFGDSLSFIYKKNKYINIAFSKHIDDPCCYVNTISKFEIDSLRRELYNNNTKQLNNRLLEMYDFMQENRISNLSVNEHRSHIDDFSMSVDYCCPPISIEHLCDTCHYNSTHEELSKAFYERNPRTWIYKLDNRWYLNSHKSYGAID